MIGTDALIAEARTWVGVPFLHQGRSRSGVDCAGFIVALMRGAGELPLDFCDVRNYSRRPNRELLTLVSRHCARTHKETRGLLVLVRWPKDSEPSHVAFLTGPTLIHCYQRQRAVVEHSYRGPWKRDTHSLWKLPGVAYE
jgi:cell wall-associated NlpC family hydrolase